MEGAARETPAGSSKGSSKSQRAHVPPASRFRAERDRATPPMTEIPGLTLADVRELGKKARRKQRRREIEAQRQAPAVLATARQVRSLPEKELAARQASLKYLDSLTPRERAEAYQEVHAIKKMLRTETARAITPRADEETSQTQRHTNEENAENRPPEKQPKGTEKAPGGPLAEESTRATRDEKPGETPAAADGLVASSLREGGYLHSLFLRTIQKARASR